MSRWLRSRFVLPSLFCRTSMCERVCPSKMSPCPCFMGSYILKFFMPRRSLSMLSWRRYLLVCWLSAQLSPGIKTCDAPDHSPDGLNSGSTAKHFLDILRNTALFIFPILVHGVISIVHFRCWKGFFQGLYSLVICEAFRSTKRRPKA